jgi:hypothetical protein
MANKKNKAAASGTANFQALRLGSRVRCTDDGVEGRIVWANAVSVKIKWDDGEAVTWRRDSLATRPIEILDLDVEQDQPTVPAEPAAKETAATAVLQAETAPTPEVPAAEPPPAAPATAQAATPEPTAAEPAPAPSDPPAEQAAAVTPTVASPAKPQRQRKAPAEPKEKKVSALDAAAKVLAEEGRPMTCKEMIEAMAAKNYWTSPGGRTPEATLYSAIVRELTTKGSASRFQKTDRGKFARTAVA